MRFTKSVPSMKVKVGERTVMLASAALVASGLLQLASAWLQWQLRLNEGEMGCRCPSHFGEDRAGTDPGLSRNAEIRKREYTWDEEDFPPSLDFVSSIDLNFNHSSSVGQLDTFDLDLGLGLGLGEPVALTIEDSRHYALDGPEASEDSESVLETDAEWDSVYPGGSGGFVRLGPQRRFFGLSVYHQLHCLDALRFAVGGRTHVARRRSSAHHDTPSLAPSPYMNGKRVQTGEVRVSHTAHCLNYLRQTILCAADVTLDPELVRGSQDVGSGLGVTHVCRDWEKVHSFVERNYEAYVAWTDSEESGAGMND